MQLNTLKRLRISEGAVTFLWGVYYVLGLLILYLVQGLNITLLLRYYEANQPYLAPNEQILTVELYTGNFFHFFMPLADTYIYTDAAILMVSLGLYTAYSSWLLRRGKKPAMVFAVFSTAYVVIKTSTNIGFGTLMLLVLIGVGAVLNVMYKLWRGDEDEA